MQRISSFIKSVASIGAYLPRKNVNMPSVFNGLNKEFLTPSTPMACQVCGFKVKGRVTRRCEACYIVFRDGRVYNICPKRPRHKQMSMRPKPHNTWILTHASQSKVRPW